ncbi:unnamed protein product [Umbelopsis sp. WA50703]
MNVIRHRIDEFWKSMDNLKDASVLEDVSRTQQSVEAALQLKIEKHLNIASEILIPGLEAEDSPLEQASNTMPDTNTSMGTITQNANEPQLESEFEAQLMASSGQPIDIENKEADFSWQGDQSQPNPGDDNDFMFNEMMTTTPTQEGTPSVNEFLKTPEFDGEKSPEDTTNDDSLKPETTKDNN